MHILCMLYFLNIQYILIILIKSVLQLEDSTCSLLWSLIICMEIYGLIKHYKLFVHCEIKYNEELPQIPRYSPFLGATTIPIALTSQCQCRLYCTRITTINTSTLIRFSLPLQSPHIILYSSSKLVLVFLHKLKMVSGLSFLGSADRETEGEEECAGIFPFGSFAWNLHAANSTLCCKCIFYCMLFAATLASLPLSLSTLTLTLTLASLAKCT